ncbi:MAG: serine protease [Clostridiales bacterium]|nr:serine protease [Clostridiales bacterium]
MKFKGVILSLLLVLTLVFAVGCESAYDIAVRNGFVGSEQEWLQSLQGTNGADGADVTINDIYTKAVESGFEGSYLDFLKEYMTFTEAPDNSAAISKGLQSAVLVYCKFYKNTGFWNVSDDDEFAQAGAGVIYRLNKEQGSAYIMTNYHVVYSSDSNVKNKISNEITVTPYGGEPINVTYVGGSATYDIAVLKAENEYFSSDVPTAVTVATPNDISVGQTVIAIGNPAGRGISATQGIISVDSEYITMSAIDNASDYVTMRVMRIDAAVNSGNSGGGLFDASGNLIGIVNAKTSDTSIENMAYAIPSSIATAVADNILKNNGTFKKGTVGITIKAQNSKGYIGSDGLIKIEETVVIEDATGGAKGKLYKGDIILSVNLDHEVIVTRQFHAIDPLLSSAPGDTVTFKVLRGGEEVTVEVVCS